MNERVLYESVITLALMIFGVLGVIVAAGLLLVVVGKTREWFRKRSHSK